MKGLGAYSASASRVWEPSRPHPRLDLSRRRAIDIADAFSTRVSILGSGRGAADVPYSEDCVQGTDLLGGHGCIGKARGRQNV